MTRTVGSHRHKPPRKQRPPFRPQEPQPFFAPACNCHPQIVLEADGLPVACCGARPVQFEARSIAEALALRAELANERRLAA